MFGQPTVPKPSLQQPPQHHVSTGRNSPGFVIFECLTLKSDNYIFASVTCVGNEVYSCFNPRMTLIVPWNVKKARMGLSYKPVSVAKL